MTGHEAQPPTIGEIDNRIAPTVINFLKNGQIAIANGCGEWTRYDDREDALAAIRQMVFRKVLIIEQDRKDFTA